MRNGFLAERDFPALTAAASKLAESKIFIDDTPGLSILELRAKSRRLKTQHDIQAIFIDYLQLLRSTSRRAQSAGSSSSRIPAGASSEVWLPCPFRIATLSWRTSKARSPSLKRKSFCK